MDGTLGTTNALLAILAAVAVLEAIALVAASVVGFLLFRHLRDLLQEVRQQVPRLADRVDSLAATMDDVLGDVKGVMADVKDVSARTAAGAERMQNAVGTAADVASFAMTSAQMVFGRKVSMVAGIARGLGMAYRILTQKRAAKQSAADARSSVTADDGKDSTTFKEAAHGS